MVIAAGVNQVSALPDRRNPLREELRAIFPDYVAPRLRPAVILELEVDPRRCAALDGQLHFVKDIVEAEHQASLSRGPAGAVNSLVRNEAEQ